jgi:PAS domain S-box-containing protein
MDTKVKTKEVLIKELHKLHEEHDLLKTSYSKDIIERKKVEHALEESEYNLKERIKELNGIYSLGSLAEEFNRLEDIYRAFVNSVVPESLQFPGKVFVSLEIDREKYSNIGNFKLSENRKYLSAPIKISGKQAGELIVAYTEEIPFIDFFEQKLINSYAERISKITERIKTQQTLEKSEIKYRNLVDNLGEGIGIVNVNEEFLFANSAAERIFGTGKGELIGKNLKEFLSDEHYINILNQTKIREKELSSSYETELTLHNREKRNLLITAVPQFDDNEMFIGTYGIFRDITERNKVEKALRESESSLRDAQEIAKMGNWELDLFNQKVKWSENCFVIYGLKPFEIEPTFEYFKSRIHPDDLHLVDEAFKNIIKNKIPFTSEMRIIFPDGTFRWFQNNMIPVFQDDKLVSLKGINFDITDRKQAETNLAESRQIYSQIINTIQEGILVYDTNLRHTVFNPFMEKFSGIPASKVLGKYPTETFPFLEEVGVIKNLRRALNGENTDVIDFHFSLPDSEISGWASEKNVPLRNVNGEIIGVIGTVHDITGRKTLEESLKSINERFVLAATTASISVWEHDFITDIIQIDDNFNKIYGYNQSNYQIEFSQFNKFIHPDDIDIIRINIEESIKSDKNVNYEFRIIRPDGDIRNISAYGKIVKDKANKPVRYIGVNMDITDLKNAELAIKEDKRELLQLNLNKDRFISILGHDLKNPLNNILGFSEVLIEDICNLHTDEIEEIAKNINKSAKITVKLLEDILMWARTQQGVILFKPQILNFRDICKNILEVLKPNADAKNIVINYSSDQINVFADNDMLKTVLRNLVSNAIKFTYTGGTISIKAEQTDSKVTISVSDNGIGIPPDNLAKLFNISEVLSTKGTTGETGTGLGLLLCKEFVEKHQGKIWVESEVGKGSDFKFTLPFYAENTLNTHHSINFNIK